MQCKKLGRSNVLYHSLVQRNGENRKTEAGQKSNAHLHEAEKTSVSTGGHVGLTKDERWS